MTKKRESFPASNEPLDNSPISNPELSPETKEALKRAEKVIGEKPKSVFKRNLDRIKRKSRKDETSKFLLAEPFPFDWEVAF